MNEIQPEIDTTTSNISSVFSNELIDKSLSCLSLENGDDVTSVDPYTTALSAYALVLANRTDDARKKIDWLMNHAQRNNSLLWWHKIGSSFSNFFPIEKLIKLNSLIELEGSGPALSVEMTSYVLLSLVKLGSKEEMVEARSIVRWLSKQRNSEGGFISTQDTVVALQVLT